MPLHPLRTCAACDVAFRSPLPNPRFCPRCRDKIRAGRPTKDTDMTTPTAPIPTAAYVLGQAREHLLARAETYDTPDGERSMARAVAVFNALTGHRLSTLEGWRFMWALKAARSAQDGYNPDDYEDLAAYAALAGEQAAEDQQHGG